MRKEKTSDQLLKTPTGIRGLEEAEDTLRNNGIGIGLSIVRKSAEKMGGRVGVESKLREGSRNMRQPMTPLHSRNNINPMRAALRAVSKTLQSDVETQHAASLPSL